MIKVGKSYYTVNVPFSAGAAARKAAIQTIKDAGMWKAATGRNTEAQAHKLADKIRATLGVPVTVNETADMAL